MTPILHHGDMRDILAGLEARFHSVVTDPPYHLASIVRRFGKSNLADVEKNASARKIAGQGASPHHRAARGFMGKQWDGGDIAFQPETWALVGSAMVPGAHLVAFGGTKGFHRMACAIEDAGFEIRDTLAWLYGSGFPKSHNQKGEWEGWGTALKPAYEPIVLARWPMAEKTVAANLAEHRTGALNIDSCRIFGPETPADREGEATADKRYTNDGATNFAAAPGRRYTVRRLKPGATLDKTGGNWRPEDGPLYHGESKPGRWPANVVHDGSEEVLAAFPDSAGQQRDVTGKEQSHVTKSAYGHFERGGSGHAARGDSGSAARFFYSAKADAADRLQSKHPTVKPVDLMRWLVRLVTPKGGLVLDPFAGSGTTGMACMAEGFDCHLIEREAEYAADIRRRLAHVEGADTPLFAGSSRVAELLPEGD